MGQAFSLRRLGAIFKAKEDPGTEQLRGIRQAVIGEGYPLQTAFGTKPLVYADYTASGRPLSFIEDFITQRVMPFYANTHTETSFTGAQTTALREEARRIIKEVLNANEEHALVFCGSGATAAIIKLIDILNLRIAPQLDEDYQLAQHIPQQQRPVVFVGPYEHHSNELPWRESIAEVVPIPLLPKGQLDLECLERRLQEFQDRPLLIGSFSAASNVTGLRTDVHRVAALLHRYGALSFWDYAAAGPYVAINMQGEANAAEDSSLDAVFISPHKFVGGPGTPGVLVVKRSLMRNAVPVVPGGGTVDFVTPQGHQYIEDPEHREEGGTPAIIESIRAGLVFKLQRDIGAKRIEELEAHHVKAAIARWKKHPNIQILGCGEADRLAIVSFMIRRQEKYLHYSYVVALLNDLFGIQARGGCSCAGPYGHWLLEIGPERSRAFTDEIKLGNKVLKPGWVRLNFNYFIDADTYEYILRAVELIADWGWRLLPYYQFDQQTGAWIYQGQPMQLVSHLSDLTLGANVSDQPEPIPAHRYSEYLRLAEKTLRTTPSKAQSFSMSMPRDSEALRWFVLPQECLQG